jgi:phage tail-like protein
MPIGQRTADPAASFRFKIEITGVEAGRFTECSGLEFSSETKPYEEGGLNSYVHQFPGRFKFSNVSLRKGIATEGNTLWTWVKNTVTGQITPHDVTITLMDDTGTGTVRSWTFISAYPIKWSATGISSGSNDIAIEELTLTHQGMDFAQ